MQTNREGCQRLARRAGRILLDVNEQMAGRWDSAPELLLKNLGKLEGYRSVVLALNSNVLCYDSARSRISMNI